MRMSLLTRAAVAAIATTTAVGMTSAAEAAPTAVHKPFTSLSVRVSRGVIKPDENVRISGVLQAGRVGLAGKIVRLEAAAPGGKFFVVGASATNQVGGVTFVGSQQATKRYKLVFKGTVKLAATRSAVATVKVSDKLP